MVAGDFKRRGFDRLEPKTPTLMCRMLSSSIYKCGRTSMPSRNKNYWLDREKGKLKLSQFLVLNFVTKFSSPKKLCFTCSLNSMLILPKKNKMYLTEHKKLFGK